MHSRNRQGQKDLKHGTAAIEGESELLSSEKSRNERRPQSHE